MRTVYALTSGSYSSYRVHALFEQEGDANDAITAGAGEDVHALTLYAPGEKPKRIGHHRAFASIALRDGRENNAPFVSSDTRWIYDDTQPVRPVLRETRNELRINLIAEGEDREAVLKMVADRYAALVAEREGIA